MANQETISHTPEHMGNPEALEAAGIEHRERLRNSLEEAEAKHGRKQQELEHAQREALERASSLKEVAKVEKSPAQKRTLFTKKQREASFDRQMEVVRDDLSPQERRFSKLIHQKNVEKASEVVGTTIARPNALLAGSVSAFLLVTIVYLVAKHYGYPLSGFETIAAFVLGWILGFIYDYIRLLVSGKK